MLMVSFMESIANFIADYEDWFAFSKARIYLEKKVADSGTVIASVANYSIITKYLDK